MLPAALGVAALGVVRRANATLRQSATQLLEGSRQEAAAAGQIPFASQSLGQRTSQQAIPPEETSSSTTEIAAIARRNAENTRRVSGLMAETAQRVEDANHSLEERDQSMKEINAPHEKISKIVRVVDEIAFHTNILALHAAMETARAAEAGMGLAVAAGEERNLAHRRAQAAKDTAALIEESIAKSTEGNKKLPLVAGSIQQVTDSATPVKALLDEVDVGSQRPSRAIEQIAPAVTRLEVVSQRSAGRAEQSAAANEELAALAQTIYGIAERVRQRVGGNSQASTREVGPRRSPAPTAPAASHTADLGALDRALRQAGRTKVVAPAPIARRSPGRDAFPLDDTQNNF